MKNSGNPTAQLVIQKEFLKLNENFQDIHALLIVTDIDELQINYLNKIASIYCGIEADAVLQNKINFHKEVIHPEDYLCYMEHLASCKSLGPGVEKEIIIRLKDWEGKWNKFCFKDRVYNWSPNGEKNAVLSLAHNITSEVPGRAEQKDSCENVAEPDSPQNQNKYQQLVDSLDQSYCIIELIFNREGQPVDYIFTETNPAFEKHVNLKNVTGRTMRELVPDHEEHWFKLFGEIAITGKAIRFQEHAENIDQSWFDVYSFRIGGKNSRKLAVLFHNITNQKQAEETLIKDKKELEDKAKKHQQESLENSELLQTVFDTTNLAIAVYKTLYDEAGEVKDFLFLRTNKVLREMYLEEDVVGKTYLQISKYGVEYGIFDSFKRAVQTGEVMDREFFLDKGGFKNWLRFNARPQNNLLIVSIEDVTAQKAEAQKLKEAVRFNKQLVQTSPDTILIINLNDFNVRYVNQDMLTREGMTKKRIKGMILTDILPYLHPRDREKMINFHKKILKSSEDEILDIEFRVKTQGSTWEWFNARGKVFNRKNKSWVDEYVILVKNITEQKITQRALINAEKLSIQGEVARTFAHELRNPLASIRMATDVIKHKLDEPQKEVLGNYLDILSRSTKVLNNLVANLLDSANYTPANLVKVDLAECVDYTIEQAADRIYLTGVKVIKNYKGPYMILADKEKLHIALLNIIVNASEATSPDKGIIELTIKKHKTDFALSIKDNGHGLEQEQIDQLFDAFYTNKETGTGIGLTSVKNILEEHDAQIKVSSKPEQGTTFKLLFENIEINTPTNKQA